MKLEKLKNYKKNFLDITFYSIIGGALFLQNLLFYDIATKGKFIAAEQNPYVLAGEMSVTILGDYLFAKNYIKFLKNLKRKI
jgi:hypothetical protein